MIKLSSMWHVPDESMPDDLDRRYFDVHVPTVRRLPGIRRHVVLKAMPGVDGRSPAWWRGEDIWFEDRATFDAVTESPEWKDVVDGAFLTSVAGLEMDLFEIDEEYVTDKSFEPGHAPPNEAMFGRGTWQLPPGCPPEVSDRFYWAAHVPNVRSDPQVHRHVVLRAVEWPSQVYTRWWRGADVWRSRADYEAAPSGLPTRPTALSGGGDRFDMLIAGLRFDNFLVEEEWAA